MNFEPDPEYELVKYEPPKRGRQCGKCGMKFDYNMSYGFYCMSVECPMGWGPTGPHFVTTRR
jgi:hypothetical protein